LAEGVGKTEIDDLEIQLFIEEEILGLDVSVDDAQPP
jgi:hypothetical protein